VGREASLTVISYYFCARDQAARLRKKCARIGFFWQAKGAIIAVRGRFVELT
jgi:hypothetical protein